MFSILILLNLIPLLALPINGLGIIFSKNNKKIFAFLFALSLALIAYLWHPIGDFDLTRWHAEMDIFKHFSFNYMLSFTIRKIEIINYMSRYFISLTNNYNLLQFIYSFIGYFLIFYMISDYSMKHNSKKIYTFIILLFTILSLNYVDFVSGIWNFSAIILFSFGYYCEKELKTKYIHWVIYIATIFIHIAMIFALAIRIYSLLIRKTNKFLSIFILFLGLLLIPAILTFLDSYFNSTITNTLYDMYVNYFINDKQFFYLHSIENKILSVMKMIPYLISILLISKKNKEQKKDDDLFIINMIVGTLTLIFIVNAPVFIRFAYLIVLLSIPNMFRYLTTELRGKNKLLVIIIIITFCFAFEYKQIMLLKTTNILEIISDNFFKTIFQIIRS